MPGDADRYGAFALQNAISAGERVGSMLRNALHASIGAQGQRLDARGLRPRPAAIARFIAEAAFAALVVALFIGWLISRPGSDLASGRGSQCVSLGRGGALCAEPAQGSTFSHRDDDCMSLGKGGRICFARPGSTGS
jgi:hypothetical protein